MGISAEELVFRELDSLEREIGQLLARLCCPADDRRRLLALPPKRVAVLFTRVERMRWLLVRFTSAVKARNKVAWLRMTRLTRDLPSAEQIAEWRDLHEITEAA